MRVHWSDYCETVGPLQHWRGLALTVRDSQRPGLVVNVCPPGCISLTLAARTCLWARTDDGYYGYELLRSTHAGALNVISPIPFQRVRENSVPDRDVSDRRWAHAYVSALTASDASPLHQGSWFLGRDLDGDRPRDLGVDLIQTIVRRNSHDYIDWDHRKVAPLALRAMSDPTSGRVHAWRKHARAGSLPPVLLYWVSGLCTHVVLDGHDRLVAALLEERSAPALYIYPMSETVSKSTDQDIILHHVGDALTTAVRVGQRRPPITVENANRLLLNAFVPKRNRLTSPVIVPQNRACSGRRTRGAPTIRQQRVEFGVGVRITDASQHVRQVLGGFDAVSDA